MSPIACRDCGESFDGRVLAWCPRCLAGRWLATPELVRQKHDPDVPAARLETYRSVITPRMKAEIGEVLGDAARRGSWFWDRDYSMWIHITDRPLGRAPGVGIPAGREQAEHALDTLFIAEADSPEGAHVFAADAERHRAQIKAGVFEPLGGCSSDGCENLRAPGGTRCRSHEPAT
jgi:hypothetical protein